ncbi:hypothetical protein DMC30DRAFT_270149 [Rhodotorula diobovata]|uniref:Cohesin loading factor-domain-containing protein n=1 Tax=Rhodotorula diobovata TaxID=5288 RepID=A0A5C5FTZ9_9BASI|nr:hypothetical protein DMC30DRAFT_270149 [Rhodotorula diobovata]
MDPYALPPGHTGAAQDHPSPTKRRRVAPPPPSSSSSVDPLAGPVTTLPAPPGSLQPAQTAVHIQPPPLATLPAPLALLSLAVSLRASAHALLPSLAKRPSASSNSSQARYAHAWADYSRLQHALVAVLRAAVTLTATASEYAGGRLELRACAMLAQQLVDMYEGSGHEKIVAPEADRALARAISISQSHPSLAPYGPALSLLHLRLALFSSKPLKYIRTTLRRLLASLSSPSPSPTAAAAAAAAATYSAHAFAASLPGASLAERLAAWDSVVSLAQQHRGGAQGPDAQVLGVALLASARLALKAEDYPRCAALLDALRDALPGEDTDGRGAAWPPRVVRVQDRLVRCLYHAQVGDAKAAKETLKEAHRLLDAAPGADRSGEMDEVAVLVGGPGTHDTATLHFKVPPQSTLYPFAFLASAAIHLDPQGKTPRAQLFGEEGVRIVEQRLNGREVSLPVPSLSSITTTLHRSAALKSRLHLLLAALSTLRSDYPAAEAHLAHAVRVARAHADAGEADDDDATETETESDLAGTLAPVALAWALVRCARAAREGKDEREAQRALEAVLDATARGPRPTTAQGAHMRRCAALSLLLLRLGNPGLAADGGVTSTDALARLLTSSSSSALPAASSPSSPAAAAAFPPRTSAPARLATALASALTVGSITASKTALSQALTLTNQMGATHARAGVLALLANVFLWTREGEAQKMLASALRLASSFGSAAPHRTVDGVPVGHARLSLWLGERLAGRPPLSPRARRELPREPQRRGAPRRAGARQPRVQGDAREGGARRGAAGAGAAGGCQDGGGVKGGRDICRARRERWVGTLDLTRGRRELLVGSV